MAKAVPAWGPAATGAVPMGQEGQGCTIVFGHNVQIQKVLMQFSVLAERLIFSPDDARDVARQLQRYADLAEGKSAR